VQRTQPASLARSWIALTVCAGAMSLAGCSSSQTSAVATVAEDFYSALHEGDGTAACEALSPDARTELEQNSGKKCPEAILDERLPEPDAESHARVYGTMAIVSAGADTLFLSRFRHGWLVTAAGCQPTSQAEQYDCTVKGG
jgi:hypothetical protein